MWGMNSSRDHGYGVADRLAVLHDPNGVRACRNHFECTQAFPRGIRITEHTNHLKRKIKASKEQAR
jgi:succinate dehydrogenase/fumarate reductase-like Fe-S protein